ncbi:MAG: zf-HC2 domain-containing protein [Proteobacteria bacterium]|nr:zf-HC2 domain-containing protein [Pseudomonadota bacterium]MBU1710598.1 zf-HC2 domain-containing protein [Pseudomonadota bacterium]
MECTKIQHQFSDFFESDLNAEESSSVKEHLDSCSQCAEEWKYFRDTLHLLHSIEPEPVPRGMLAGIHAKLEKKNMLLRFLLWFRHANPTMTIPAAATTIVIAFTCMALYKTVLQEKPFMENQSIPKQNIAQKPGDGPSITVADATPYSGGNNPLQNFSIYNGPAEQYPGFFQNNITPHGLAFAPDISFASTGRSARGIYQRPGNHLLNRYVNNFLGSDSTNHVPPDLLITVQATNQRPPTKLYHSLLAEKTWNPRVLDGNLLILFLPPEDLPHLQLSLKNYHVQVSPPGAQAILSSYNRDIIRVAILIK